MLEVPRVHVPQFCLTVVFSFCARCASHTSFALKSQYFLTVICAAVLVSPCWVHMLELRVASQAGRLMPHLPGSVITTLVSAKSWD